MKKTLGLLVLVAALAVVLFPQDSRAETSFSFSVSDGGYYGEPWHHHRRHHHPRLHHHPRYYSSSSVVFVEPAPTVIYQPAPVQYVPATSLVADPVSPSYTNESGQLCREYLSSAFVGGRQNQVYGTACLQPDGAWRVVD